MLDPEFDYYVSHQKELVDKYEGKYIVIIGEEVIGSFTSEVEAYSKTIEEHEPGTFLIQLCNPGSESYTQTFHSRVYV